MFRSTIAQRPAFERLESRHLLSAAVDLGDQTGRHLTRHSATLSSAVETDTYTFIIAQRELVRLHISGARGMKPAALLEDSAGHVAFTPNAVVTAGVIDAGQYSIVVSGELSGDYRIGLLTSPSSHPPTSFPTSDGSSAWKPAGPTRDLATDLGDLTGLRGTLLSSSQTADGYFRFTVSREEVAAVRLISLRRNAISVVLSDANGLSSLHDLLWGHVSFRSDVLTPGTYTIKVSLPTNEQAWPYRLLIRTAPTAVRLTRANADFFVPPPDDSFFGVGISATNNAEIGPNYAAHPGFTYGRNPSADLVWATNGWSLEPTQVNGQDVWTFMQDGSGQRQITTKSGASTSLTYSWSVQGISLALVYSSGASQSFDLQFDGTLYWLNVAGVRFAALTGP